MNLLLTARIWAHKISFKVLDSVVLAGGRRSWVDGELVSFPIATYDRLDILVGRTIPAILAQSHQNIEIVVVLDGTPVELRTKLAQLRDPRIRIVGLNRRTKYPTNPEERWMVAGWRPRNHGVRHSRGEWVYWVSDDDVLLTHAVELLLKEAREAGVESVSGGYQAGLVNPITHYPVEGQEEFGHPISGPPAWLCRSYVAKMRWNRFSWAKKWNRPSDYDLFERMVKLGVRFSSIRSIVATQPEVAGTQYPGRRGAIQAWTQKSAQPSATSE